MNWEDLKDMYSGLEVSDIPNLKEWMSGGVTDWEVPNFTTARHPAFGGSYGWGASPEEKSSLDDRMAQGIDNAIASLGMGGVTKIVGSGPNKMIEAWHNTIPNKQVGQLGFVEGKGFNSLRDIKVDPQFRGQGYADELLDTFKSHAGQEPRFGGTITNSPGFWQSLSGKMRADYPQFSKGLDTALISQNRISGGSMGTINGVYIDPGEIGGRGSAGEYGESSPWLSIPDPERPETALGRYERDFSQALAGKEPGLEDQFTDIMDMINTTIVGGKLAKWGLRDLGLPAAAGMIRMGGKEIPKAFALRTMDLAEEPFLKRTIKKGLPHDVSSTTVSPSQVGSFGDAGNQYGLMFDILDDKAIKAASPFDMMVNGDFIEPGFPARRSLTPAPYVPKYPGDIDDLIRDQKSWYNEAILSLGENTPFSGVRILPKASKFYDPNKELNAVTMARSLNVPIFNIPGIDQLGDFMSFAGKLDKGGATGGRWVKAKGQYSQGVTDTELRSNIWKDLYK